MDDELKLNMKSPPPPPPPPLIEDWTTRFDLAVNDFSAEYAGCGSHQIQLVINVDKDELFAAVERWVNSNA